jgi:quercetin dioxygenase-like cupin family protein
MENNFIHQNLTCSCLSKKFKSNSTINKRFYNNNKLNLKIRAIINIKIINKMETKEIEKAKTHITVEIIEYIPNSVVSQTILKKSTGNISVMSFDSGEGLAEKITPFDTFVQIIEGKAEIIISGESHLLMTGQSIVIPAHQSNLIKPNGRFKMISTVIKSGYE